MLLEEYRDRKWGKITIRMWTVVMLYAALVSLLVWHGELDDIPFLGYKAS